MAVDDVDDAFWWQVGKVSGDVDQCAYVDQDERSNLNTVSFSIV